MNRLVKKKIVKLEKENKNFNQISEEQQSKVNDVQQKIFEGNQMLEKLKSQINLNQEDMEKWMLAAKQKKEDNMMLEKYKRSDETKVKEIGLEIQRLTVERGKLERNLANQITETKACQIEVDKLVEEFNYHSEERQRIFSQWDSVVANLAKRNELQLEIGDKVVRLENEIREKQDKIEEKGRYLRREKEQNNLKKEEIKKLERENFQEKNKNHQKQKEVEDFMAQIKIIQNRLSGRARELESKEIIFRKKERRSEIERRFIEQEETIDKGRKGI
jgi:UDP-glucose:O-linked fucose beta-1,3-glucosyltransferase